MSWPMALKDEAGGEDAAAIRAGDSELTRLTVAEAIGSGFFAFIIVAAGILAERFAIHNVALAMLMTALAGAGTFAVLTVALKGAARTLFNPGLALACALSGRMPLQTAIICAAGQIAAAFLGVMAAHIVTGTGAVQNASQIETGVGVWLGEFLGTAIFSFAMLALAHRRGELAALIGALCLIAISLATPSMSFANPALTLARALTDSFTSIRLEDALVIAPIQLLAATAAFLAHRWLWPAD
jgi:glycerol uptake facilitator-like aquaporin